MPEQIATRLEAASDDPAIMALQRAAFGPGAYARAAFRLREQARHDPALSFVTERDGELIASVRMTHIRIGEEPGLLLGPLVVDPCCKNMGFGKALMRLSMETARLAGCRFVLLVGDASYYWPFGFRATIRGQIRMPGPVDPARLLVAELKPGAASELGGTVLGVAPVPPD